MFKNIKNIFVSRKRIYMDFASTTPVDKRVVRAMSAYWNNNFHNPSALYSESLEAKKAIEEARRKIGAVLAVQPGDIIFTASGTESDNMALLGAFEEVRKNWTKEQPPKILISAIEHPGIREAAKEIVRRGGEVMTVPVEGNGIVSIKKIEELVDDRTVLVSVMYANNEIGTIQPVRDIGMLIKKTREKREQQLSSVPLYFHTDASQAANYLDCTVSMLGVDMMTLDGSKIYGPKGVGILVVRGSLPLHPTVFGGGQENGARSGTENVPLIVGFARALEIAHDMQKKETKRLTTLRDYAFEQIANSIPEVIVNGDMHKRLANNINVCVPHIDSEFAVIKLDREGVCCSTASSCSNLSAESRSYVIEALGKGRECATSSLRFTLGRTTTRKHVDRMIFKLTKVIDSLHA